MIDMNKEYVTKGEGLPVRIYCTDGGGNCPVHGAVLTDGYWYQRSWDLSGRALGFRDHKYNLIEKPQTITRWVNVYVSGGGVGSGKPSRDIADKACLDSRIGVLRLEITGDNYEVFKEDV